MTLRETTSRRRDRRWRTVGSDRRRRARPPRSTARSWSSNAKRRPAESPATATISATACATCGASSPAPPTPGGSPPPPPGPVLCWRPRRWSPGGAADRTLQITSPRGVRIVTADAVILATGCARAATTGTARRRGPTRRGVHHRPAAEPGAHASHPRRRTCRDRRRRAGQLVGGADFARSRLRDSGDGERSPTRRGVRGVPDGRPGAAGRSGADRQPGDRHPRQGPGPFRHRGAAADRRSPRHRL